MSIRTALALQNPFQTILGFEGFVFNYTKHRSRKLQLGAKMNKTHSCRLRIPMNNSAFCLPWGGYLLLKCRLWLRGLILRGLILLSLQYLWGILVHVGYQSRALGQALTQWKVWCLGLCTVPLKAASIISSQFLSPPIRAHQFVFKWNTLS